MKTREVKLDMANRFKLLGILPKEGDYLTLKILRELRESLIPSEEEKKQIGLVELPNGLVQWDLQKEKAVGSKTINIGEILEGLVIKTLKDLDSRKKLADIQMELYEIFLLAKE
jgi:hypothetical protein